MNTNQKALAALVKQRYGHDPELMARAMKGVARKADTIVAITQEQRAKEIAAAKKLHPATRARVRRQDRLKSGTWIVEKVETVDGLPVPRYLGPRMNITTHQTTDQPLYMQRFNGARDAKRAAMLQGEGWEAKHVSQMTVADAWIRVEPSATAIPEQELGVERGLSR